MPNFSHLEPILKKLPNRPGVYLMQGKNETILYVGKSVNLKSRVNSYFHPQSVLNAGKTQMVKQVETIDWIETTTEVEALVLETNLIKKHRPKYNVLMKDDKNLSYIVINEETVGEVHKTRIKWEKGTYFGPFTSGVNINGTLKTLRRIFKIRSCRVQFEKTDGELSVKSKAGRTLPCMDYYIGLCPAPCVLEKEKLTAHATNVESLKKFLRGQMGEVIAELREKMMARAKVLEFEEAGKIKEQIEALEMLSERQVARDAVKWNVDNIEYLEKYGKRFLAITFIRNGEIVGIVPSQIDSPFEETAAEIIELFVVDRYETEDVPGRLVIEKEYVSDSLRAFLESKKVAIDSPIGGTKNEIRLFTEKNLLNFAYRTEMERLTNKTLSKSTMESILETIGYEVPKKGPVMFECYDNSHTDGHFTVASRSVIVNGKSENSLYRKYKLKTLEKDKIDDFESMREIMERRTIEGLEQGNFPTLILIDGGKWQLSSALEGARRGIDAWMKMRYGKVEGEFDGFEGGMAVSEENVDITTENEAWRGFWQFLGVEQAAIGAGDETRSEVALQKISNPSSKVPFDAAIATPSRDEIESRLPYFASIAKREEEIFIPDESVSFRFEPGSSELMLLQKIRDEAHRFAISFNRKLRSGEMKKNLLEELPGFGPATRKKLMKLAGSVDNIRNLSMEELETVCNKTQIETLIGHGLYE